MWQPDKCQEAIVFFDTLWARKSCNFLAWDSFLSLYVTCSRFRREAFQAPRNYYCELLAGKASQAGFLGLFKKNEKKARRSPEKYLIQNCKNSIDLNATHNYCQENFLARLSSKTSNRPNQWYDIIYVILQRSYHMSLITSLYNLVESWILPSPWFVQFWFVYQAFG